MASTKTVLTAADGTSAVHTDVLYVDPARRHASDDDAGLIDGMNGPFVANMLSAFLMHERCGLALYRSVGARTHNPALQRRYTEFANETAEHVHILEQVITQIGGDPGYVSPAARAVRAMGDSILQSTFLTSGTLDVMTAEMVMLDAVLLAETIDHANWQGVAAMAEEASDAGPKQALQDAYDEVAPEEDQHLAWARTTRLKMTRLQASSSAMATAGARMEEMVAAVANWFSSD